MVDLNAKEAPVASPDTSPPLKPGEVQGGKLYMPDKGSYDNLAEKAGIGDTDTPPTTGGGAGGGSGTGGSQTPK